MRDAQEYVETALSRVQTTEQLVGIFVSQVGAIATVDIGNRRVQVKSATSTPVLPSDAVRLERRGSSLVLTGPSNPRATTGRVTAAGNPATVEYPNGSGITATLPVAAGVTVTVGSIVFLDWSSGGLVVATISAPVPPVIPPAPDQSTPQRNDRTFFAQDSGSYQAGFGWRTNDVWSSDKNIGAWFYGSAIRDTIPDDARILSAEIFLPLVRQTGAAPFGRHTAESKPGGTVAILATSTLPGRNGWVAIPTSLLDHLKANPGGLGFALGGYNIWRGTQAGGPSGAVHVIYET